MHRRPLSVTIFAVFVLFLTAWNGIRLFAAFSNWRLLIQLAAQPGPAYIVITALVWVAFSLIIFWGAWTGKNWTIIAGWVFILSYILFFWLDRIFLRPLERGQDLFIVLTLQLLAIGLTIWALATPSGRTYFNKRLIYDIRI